MPPFRLSARRLAALVVALVLFAAHLPATRNTLFTDDAADYVRASQSPLHRTWLNTDSASPAALEHLRHNDPEFRERPWDALYAAGDNAALRHFHSPVSFYPLHLVHALFPSDRALRILTDAAASAACALLVFALAGLEVPLVLATLLGLFAGFGSRFVEVSVDPTPHVWFILFALAFLYLLAEFFRAGRTRHLLLAAAALGACFATLEFTVELFFSIPCIIAALVWTRPHALAHWRKTPGLLLKSLAVFLLTTFVLWPGGWLRGGYLESYGVLSATVVLKNKTAFGEHLTAGLIYRTVFAGHIVLLLLTIAWVVCALYLLARRRLSVAGVVFSSYAVWAFALGVADHFRLNTYVSEFVVFAIAAAGLVLRDALHDHTSVPSAHAHTPAASSLRPAAYVVLCALLGAGCVTEFNQRHDDWSTRPWLANVFAAIRANVPAGSTVLVNNNREALQLYLPSFRFEPTLTPTSPEPRTPERAASARFGLFNNAVTPPAPATTLATIPAANPTPEILWRKAEPGRL